ncbi:MAG: FtsX-like permease family protein [Gammaproteobacteria bacterium]|nr:FtsX-like permease family protein [Gammaproteobacteria bacterium]
MLSLRLLIRELRAGQLTLLALALVIAVAAMTSTAVLTNRIDRAMVQDASALLGGDLVIRGDRPLAARWIDEGRALGLVTTETVEFPSIVGFVDRFELAAIKVVTDGYPLRGRLDVAPARAGQGIPTQGIPAPGTAWVDPSLASQLGVDVGDTVSVGETTLAISGILVFEPDRGGSFVSLSPRLMMNRADLGASNLVQDGSRIRYYQLFAGEAADRFRARITPELDISQRVRGLVDGRPEVGSALTKATQYLTLAGLLTVMLSGAAIALTARRWAEDHIVDSALFRTFGRSSAEVAGVFAGQLLLLAIAASVIGIAIGYGVQLFLVDTVASFLSVALPAPSAEPALLGLATGLITTIGFAAPALIQLHRVPPIRILKRDYPMLGPGRVLTYGLALAGLGLLALLYTQNLPLTALVLLAVVGLVGLILLIGRLAIRTVGPLERLGPAWRFGMQQLLRDPGTSGGQLIAFSLTALAVTMVAMIRLDLVETWESQLPVDAPNTFALNITKTDAPAFSALLAELGAESAPLYPIVRGRLETINGTVLAEHPMEDEIPGSVRRELSLTEASVLGRDNRLVDGRWFTETDGAGLVTVEAELARELNVRVGDQLAFVVGPDPVVAEVVGIRAVQWDSMLPNFFMIFSPGTLASFNATMLTSLNFPDPVAQTTVVARAFPSVTLLSIDAVLNQVRGILARVTEAVSFVLWFVLAGGVLVLMASIQTSLHIRKKEAAILRSLGGSDRLLSQAQWAEFLVLGALAGGLAAAASELLGRVLYTQILNLEWSSFFSAWIGLPLISALLIGTIGRWSAREARQLPPAHLLKIAES